MTDPNCPLCKGTGWVCEIHPTKPFEHDDCAGPGDPCNCNPEQSMPPGFRVHCDTDRGKLN